MTSISDQ